MLFDPYEYHMDICNDSCLSVQPAILRGKNLTLDITCKLFDQVFFLTAMPISTISFYHFILLSLTLTLPFSSQGQCKAEPIGFIFSHTFHLSRVKFDVVMKPFKLNILRFLLGKIC